MYIFSIFLLKEQDIWLPSSSNMSTYTWFTVNCIYYELYLLFTYINRRNNNGRDSPDMDRLYRLGGPGWNPVEQFPLLM